MRIFFLFSLLALLPCVAIAVAPMPVPLDEGPYFITKKKIPDGPLVTVFFFPEDADLAAGYLEKTVGYIERFTALFGPFPYNEYNVVATRKPHGLAFPGYTLLGQTVIRLPFIKDTSLGHEVLHAWFGNAVETSGANWAEGLVSYLADHTFAAERGEGGPYRKNILIDDAAWLSDNNRIQLIDFLGAADREPGAKQIRAVGYGRGTMFFHMLRKKIGDQAFFQNLRQLYAEKKDTAATWEDIRFFCEQASGKELTRFFQQWLTASDSATLSVSRPQVVEKEGLPHLVFDLKQTNTPPLQLEVPLVVDTPAGSLSRTIPLDSAGIRVEIALADRPTRLVIDPEYDLLRRLETGETPPVLARFLGAGNKVVVVPPAVMDIYAALLAALTERGVKTVAEQEMSATETKKSAVLFLDPHSPLLRSLVGPVRTTREGFSLQFWNNPLNPDTVLGAASGSSEKEVQAVANRLFHYGRYSSLLFAGGRILEKKTAAAATGMVIDLEEEPAAIPAAAVSSLTDILSRLRDTRVVLVGETHTQYGDHLLQLAVIRAMHRQGPHLTIGMEMFPASSQQALDRYIQGNSDEKQFLKESNYFSVWGYDYRLYRDILRFARRYRIPVVGLNAEKKTTRTISRKGMDTLTPEQRLRLPQERDLALPGYRHRLEKIFQQHPMADKKQALDGFLMAQGVWDETMAETAANYLAQHPDTRLVLLAGRGHTHKVFGIPPRLVRRMDLPLAVISPAVPEASPQAADFLVWTKQVELSPKPLLGVFLAADHTGTGALVERVTEKGGAAKAGILAGDRIVSLDGVGVTDGAEVTILMLDKEQAEKVTVEAMRTEDDEEKRLFFEVLLTHPASPH